MAGISEIAKKTGLTKHQILSVFDAIKQISCHQRLRIEQFGSFYQRTVQKNVISSVTPKKKIKISYSTIGFKAYKNLRKPL